MGHWSVLGMILLLHVYVSWTLVRYTRLLAVSVFEHFMNCACFDVVLCIPNMVIDGLMTHDYKTCLTNQKGMVDFVAIIYWVFWILVSYF